MYYYKLKADELWSLVSRGLINATDVAIIQSTSLQRTPHAFSTKKHKITLNQANSIFLNSINYYGGEHFNEPYYFVAEITHCTNASAFSRFMNKHNIPRRLFHY
jgi:hypothetical protein